MKERIIDILVPFGLPLRNIDGEKPFKGWQRVFLQALPQTFFIYWLFSLIPVVGTFFYTLVFIPLSAHQHIKSKFITERTDKLRLYLWYFVVITIGFGGIWSFIGHTIMADTIAEGIGWQIGSPFQAELAFYTLGSAIAALMAIWLRGHMITALIVSKSIFWYGAALVHIEDALVNQNYSLLNIGAPLIGDLVLPTIFLTLLILVLRDQFENRTEDQE
jgi:hypothetical protein